MVRATNLTFAFPSSDMAVCFLYFQQQSPLHLEELDAAPGEYQNRHRQRPSGIARVEGVPLLFSLKPDLR